MAPIESVPPGTKTTDYAAADRLRMAAPMSFRKGQDVVVAASRYRKGSGMFSSERSRLQRLQRETYELARALDADGYSRPSEKPKEKVFRFMNEFAHIFPNWQDEYAVLNRMIPHFW